MNLLDVLQPKQNYTLIDIILVYCKDGFDKSLSNFSIFKANSVLVWCVVHAHTKDSLQRSKMSDS